MMQQKMYCLIDPTVFVAMSVHSEIIELQLVALVLSTFVVILWVYITSG